MQKLKLDLNDLRVESFETTLDAAGAEGAMLGQSVTMTVGCGCTLGVCPGLSNQCGGTSSYCGVGITNCAHLCTD